MDLLSGYSDNALMGFNGYTPQANAAIANNNAAYNANQGYVADILRGYDPFASGGGFGKQTDYYSSLGAAYGRATGGFDGSAPGWSDPQPQEAPAADFGFRFSPFSLPQQPFNSYGLPGGDGGYGDPYATQSATSPSYMQTAPNALPQLSFADRYSAAPEYYPGLQTAPNALPQEILTGMNPSPAQLQLQPNYWSDFNSRFSFPTPDPSTGVPDYYTPQDFPGWSPPSPASNMLPWSGPSLRSLDANSMNSSQGVGDPMGYGDPYTPQIGNNHQGQQNFNDLYGWRAGGQGLPQMMQPADYNEQAQQQGIDSLREMQKLLEEYMFDPNKRYDPHTVPLGSGGPSYIDGTRSAGG